ncbi:MAG: YdjY domain-containing protein [Pirellulaceae bacterium]
MQYVIESSHLLRCFVAGLLFVAAVPSIPAAHSQQIDADAPIADVPKPDADEEAEEADSPQVQRVKAAFEAPENAKLLAPDARLWVDKANRRVIIDGYVAVREGLLEMFACPAGTKEHESAVAVLARSQYVHAALLAIGATPGRPVQFQPEFMPPSGDRIAVWVLWRSEDGKRHRMKAQEWICKTGTEENLDVDFVFAGSQWWTDPRTNRDYYSADDGDLICVSNFQSATLDVPIESSKDAEYLQFTACEKKIPPRGTPVRVVMIPMSPALNAKPNDSQAKPADDTKPAAGEAAKGDAGSRDANESKDENP